MHIIENSGGLSFNVYKMSDGFTYTGDSLCHEDYPFLSPKSAILFEKKIETSGEYNRKSEYPDIWCCRDGIWEWTAKGEMLYKNLQKWYSEFDELMRDIKRSLWRDGLILKGVDPDDGSVLMCPETLSERGDFWCDPKDLEEE